MKIDGKWYVVFKPATLFGRVYASDESDWIEIRHASDVVEGFSLTDLCKATRGDRPDCLKLFRLNEGSIFLRVRNDRVLVPSVNLYELEGVTIE